MANALRVALTPDALEALRLALVAEAEQLDLKHAAAFLRDHASAFQEAGRIARDGLVPTPSMFVYAMQ